ncbi:hypothetical protein TrVE_jg10230 [Triparma verrucosa]|uniref:JmjC domain-containing protein n=1 Tax=Triparma verrucosa TaxID=1606542 RepID=A0A9W7EN92_9STRA|nr:hypothetical protein TrVE_jg10230 [Triparma verrucosa]
MTSVSRSAAILSWITLVFAVLYPTLADLWANKSNKTLLQVDRVSEADLPYEVFLEKYLKPGVPVIIKHDGPDSPFTEGAGDVLLENVIRRCGDKKLNLLPPTVRTVSRNMNPIVKGILSAVLFTFQGKTVQQWLDERTARKISFVQSIVSPNHEYEESWFLRSAAVFIPSMFHRLLLLLSRPPYLADLARNDVCKSVLGEHIDEPLLQLTQYELKTLDLLSSSDESKLGTWPSLDAVLRFDDTDKFFWGGAGASSYPLHRDVQDADTFFTMFTGCKDFVMVDPVQHKHLTSLDIPMLHIWKDDLFINGRPEGLERAWRGVLHPGETLYMPGDFIHEVRVKCPNTSNICRRPWRASATRNISADTLALYEDHTYEELVKRSWLYATIDYVDSIIHPKSEIGKQDVYYMSGK